MFTHRTLFLLLLCVTALSFAEEDLLNITIATSESMIPMFYTNPEGKSCHERDGPLGTTSQRGLADLFILCKAFHFANQPVSFHLVPAPGYKRALRMVKNGVADMPAETIWSNEIDNEIFLASAPVIQEGEFHKGIFTLADHPIQNSSYENINFSDLRAVTLKNWSTDWLVLNQLSNNVVSATSYESIYLMLAAKRADFTLMEFSSGPLATESQGITLSPIKNVKVALPGSRHFVVAKSSNKAALVNKSLAQGIKKMREQGLIKAIYKNFGVFNEETQGWRIRGFPKKASLEKTE